MSQARNTRCVCAYENALTLVGTTLTEWGSMIYGVMMLKQGRGACRRCRMVGMFCAAGLAAAGVTGLGGCDNLARSRGQFQLVGAFGDSAIGAEGHPLNKDLFVPKLDDQGNETEPRTQVPLVKVGHRDPWTGKLLTLTPGSTWSKQSSYMVVDVTNVMRDPTLGSAGDSAKFRTRLMALADLLLVAADANGEVYWRHLTTYLAAHKTVSRTGQVAVGAGTAASFISPVLGASIAGTGLLADTLAREWTEDINVEAYAVIRKATSTHRDVLRQTVVDAAANAEPGKASVDLVLRRAYDYAFSYSIQGALASVEAQKIELDKVLISGESTWAGILARQDIEILRARVKSGKLTGTDKTAAEARLAKWDAAEAARVKAAEDREQAERTNREKIAKEKDKTALAKAAKEAADAETAKAEAEKARAEAEKAKAEAELKALEAKKKVEEAAPKGSATSTNAAPAAAPATAPAATPAPAPGGG